MVENIFKRPPINRLTQDEAIHALVMLGDDDESLEEALGTKVKPGLLVKFYRELKSFYILNLVYNHGCISDSTQVGYLWHPRHRCGLIYTFSDGFAEIDDAYVPCALAIQSLDSAHLAEKLAEVLLKDEWMPLQLQADEVELTPGVLNLKDLAKALAEGVFAGAHR